jgi:type IV pilus assembly protein PilE
MTLIELMIVTVVIGILAAISMANYSSMVARAKVAQVQQSMHIVQLAIEEFSTRNNGDYPANVASVTADGGLTLPALLPGGTMPQNPFTQAVTTLDWTNVGQTPPTTDPAGGIALNTSQSAAARFDMYDIVGANEAGVQLALVLGNY